MNGRAIKKGEVAFALIAVHVRAGHGPAAPWLT